MNIKEIEKILTDGGIAPREAKIEAKMLVKHFLGISDITLMMNDEFLRDENVLMLASLRASKRVPIQHIIGSAHFMGEEFIVNENVLIPRDETEFLVRKAVEMVNEVKGKREKKDSFHVSPFTFHSLSQSSNPLVLDIGTGSGCIACMVAKLSGAQVIGLDISTDALQVALENATKLKLFNKAIFRKSDIFSNVKVDEKFDIIISNPPYIPHRAKATLDKEVHFDPALALFASDDDGIEFYEKITQKAPDYLNEGGYLMFELGIGQASQVKDLMCANGFCEIEIQKDLAGIERVICGRIGVNGEIVNSK